MNTIINAALKKMIAISDGNLHDIEHFVKVHSYARCIGSDEIKDEETMLVLELAALLHDIGCPLCRRKYGSTRGDLQELEGMALSREFLSEFKLDDSVVERVVWLVGHHHTLNDVTLAEHRILLEADYLVNASECNDSAEKLLSARNTIFRTESGIGLFDSIYTI